MSALKYLIIHCTDTPADRPVSSNEIRKWHLEENGWKRVGYSDMIHLDGALENLHFFNQDNTVDNYEITNGAKGFNGCSRHVVYVGGRRGGKAHDTRTDEQWDALETYVRYMILRHPNIQVLGHRDVNKDKDCPSFDVAYWLSSICIDKKNIYKKKETYV